MNKKLLRWAVAAILPLSVNAQCPEITCPTDITVSSDPGSCDAEVTFTAPQGTDPCSIGNITFTNCSATGNMGPTQAQVDTEYAGGPLDNQVTINTQGIQEWTVPSDGIYTIEVAGAQGGGVNGGQGAVMMGDFNLTAGTTLKIMVGQAGDALTVGRFDFSGGGGTFVTDNSNTPLIIAGGGGGAEVSGPGSDGKTINNGSDGTGGYSNGIGGTGGNGGTWQVQTADGGAGLIGNGGSGNPNPAPQSFLNGGQGGCNSWSAGCGALGGFGGGGCSNRNSTTFHSAGAGGGYSGGGSAYGNNIDMPIAGGGGSFNNGTNQNNTDGSNTGHGYVNITWSGAPAITTQTAGLTSGSTFPVGTTVQTYEATDGTTTATCSFNIIVEDANDPVADNANLSDVTAECEVTSLTAPTASDLCDGTLSGVSDAVFPIDNDTVVVWTYTDAAGNAITQNQNIVITGINTGISVSGITLTSDNTNADTYQWINCADSSSVADATGQSFTPSANGEYAVIVTQGNCTDTSGCEPITTVGLEQNTLSNISLYPNPNDGHFYLNFGQTMTEVQVQITDLQGRIIENVTLKNVDTYEFNLNTSDGTYMIDVKSENFKQTLRVVKK